EEFRNFGISGTANEVGKRLREETGLRIGYHAETVDVASGKLSLRVQLRLARVEPARKIQIKPDVVRKKRVGIVDEERDVSLVKRSVRPVFGRERFRFGFHLAKHGVLVAEYDKVANPRRHQVVPLRSFAARQHGFNARNA